jgi:hypothetical protein
MKLEDLAVDVRFIPKQNGAGKLHITDKALFNVGLCGVSDLDTANAWSWKRPSELIRLSPVFEGQFCRKCGRSLAKWVRLLNEKNRWTE